MRFEIVMDPRTKENRHLRTALAESWNECGSMTKTIVSLEERLDALRQERDDEKRRHGEEMCKRDDVIAEQKKTIASLEHRLAMRSNVDSSSGKDPIEYESNKHFHNAVEAHEAAKKNGEQPPESVTPKQCGGQPGHPGKSHDIKPDGLKIYTAELCGGCGMAVSEMLKPIYKLVQDKGLDEQSKNAYTAKVTFGWCDACEDVTDPAPHLTWGTSFEGRVMAATLQYKSNPQGRTTIVDNLDAIHGFKVARSTVSNAITAAACRLEGRVRPDSVAKFIRKKTEAKAAAAAEASQVSETAQAAQPPQATETATHTAQAAQPPQATETATHTAQAAQPPQATETATHTAQAAQPPQATETATHTAQAAQPPQATETATHTAQAAQPPQATETATHTAQAAQPPQATETATHTAQAAQPPQATETATHTVQAAQPPQATETATHTAQAAQPPQATETATHTAQAAQPPQATETATHTAQAAQPPQATETATHTAQAAQPPQATETATHTAQAAQPPQATETATHTAQAAQPPQATETATHTAQAAQPPQATETATHTAQAAQPPQATETATHTAQAAQPPQATETATHTAQAAQPPQATETATHTAQAAQPPQATETATHTAQAAQPPQATETATHTAQAAQPPQATETATHTAQAAQPPQATETATHTAQAAQPPQATETATHTAQAAQPPQATETATHTAQAAQPPQATETATHTAQAAQPPQATETAPQTDKTPVGMLEYVPSGKPARKTKAELAAEDLDVPHAQTPQGVTDARLACNTTSYPGSHKLSFMEWCREYLTIAPYMGIDESKYVVAGKWCHAIVIVSPSVAMIQVRRHKNRKVINRMFGGMRNRIVIHDRISIYNGFKWIHIECWVHLIRRFFVPAKKNGIGSPEYDRYIMILELYGRLKKLAERVAERVGTPDNAAEMAACQHEIKKIWKEFEPEHNAILSGLHALIDDLGDQDPVTYLKNMMPRIMAAVKCPGAPPHNNPPEQSVRWNVVRTRHISGALPNWRAARNYGTIQTFSATCRKKGTTVYRAVQEMLKTPDWNVFTAGIPPPIFPHMA